MAAATDLEAADVRVAEVRLADSEPDNPLFAAVLTEVGRSREWAVVLRKPEADSLVIHLDGTPAFGEISPAHRAHCMPGSSPLDEGPA